MDGVEALVGCDSQRGKAKQSRGKGSAKSRRLLLSTNGQR
jgi:hypothetical protein